MVKGTKPKIYNKINYQFSFILYMVWSIYRYWYISFDIVYPSTNKSGGFLFLCKTGFLQNSQGAPLCVQTVDHGLQTCGQAIRLLFIRVHCQLRVKYHYINLDIRCESVKFAHVKYLYMVNVELVYAIFLSIPICRRSMLIFSLFVFDKL